MHTNTAPAPAATSPTRDELLALLAEADRFLQLDKGSVCIRAAYAKDQDDLRGRIKSAIQQSKSA